MTMITIFQFANCKRLPEGNINEALLRRCTEISAALPIELPSWGGSGMVPPLNEASVGEMCPTTGTEKHISTHSKNESIYEHILYIDIYMIYEWMNTYQKAINDSINDLHQWYNPISNDFRMDSTRWWKTTDTDPALIPGGFAEACFASSAERKVSVNGGGRLVNGGENYGLLWENYGL